MPSITAVEFDGDTCAIARTTVRGREVTVSAGELLNPTSFPGADALAAALRKCRRTLHLPRKCRVVLWGLPDGATPRDPGAVAALAPLTAAGFRIDRVVTPCNALAALSRLRSARGEDAICWVAINTSGVALAVIRPGQQIYTRSFGWDSTVGAIGSQARLLQRYSLVAFLSPEVKRAMGAAREIGVPVRAVVTCGNLPDLRSLTMPLIEELDVEVETLDSFEGLTVTPPAAERLTDVAAAIRLACAGAIARRTRPWDDSKRVAAHRTAALLRAAAIIGLLAGLGGGYLLLDWWRTTRTGAVVAAPTTTVTQTNPPAAPAATPAAPSAPRADPRPAAAAGRSSSPPAQPPGSPAPRTPAPGERPAPAPPPANPVTPVNPPVVLEPSAGVPAGSELPPLAITPRYGIGPDADAPALLKDPLPRVTAILVSNDGRFAAIEGGRVVGVGDAVGRRIVERIDLRTVTLREPSGARVRVGLGGRRLSAAR